MFLQKGRVKETGQSIAHHPVNKNREPKSEKITKRGKGYQAVLGMVTDDSENVRGNSNKPNHRYPNRLTSRSNSMLQKILAMNKEC